MKLSTALLASLFIGTSAEVITSKEPIFHTSSGASVYNTPVSGGTIQIKPASSTTAVFLSDDPNVEPDAPPVSEVEVDLSNLFTLESDTIEIDLGEGTMQFVRDRGTDPHANGDSSIRRRKLRRVQEVKEDKLQDVVECFLDGSSYCSQNHYDYLPPNSAFDENDPSQKFEYFEGKALFQQAEATVYVKRLVHPSDNNSNYLSGIIVTQRYEYIFRGDPVTGKTFLTQLDPQLFPSMPPPVRMEDVEDLDEVIVQENGRKKTLRQLMVEEEEEVEKLVMAQEKRKRRLGAADASSSSSSRNLQTDDGTVLDIMVAYTKTAMCQANRQSYPCDDINPAQHLNIINTAEAAVAKTNEAYINSNINTQLRLVYVHYTPYDDRSDTCSSVLGNFRRNGDGIMDEVHTVRNTWGADFVALLTSTAAGTCGGIAYLGPWSSLMFSVTKWPYAVGGTFAHELGHNYGCEHDRLNGNPGKAYEYGWQDPEAEFRTIMAYNCPGKYCPRINYFSNPVLRYNGKIMGNAANDCARKHNEGLKSIALYRSARLTNAPTMSLAPSSSSAPSDSPTPGPSGKPSTSDVPSSTPSISRIPSSAPSEYPTFDIGNLEDYERIQSPGTTAFQVQHGIMFNIEAKYDVTIRNFRIPFLRAAESVIVSLWVHDDGPFWYEKNNPSQWRWIGSPDAYSPGVTLEDPVPLPLRGGTEYGFEPIVIAAGQTKGIYILVNNTSPVDNLIGMDTRSATSCTIDALSPFSFPTWFEDESIAVSQGIYKEGWMTSVGSALDSFNFIGSIYYETSGPSSSSNVLPTGSPSLSLAPSQSLQPSETPFLEIASPQAINVAAVDGLMFNVHAKDRDVFITSFELVIYSVSPENAYDVVDMALFSHPGSFYNETLGDSVDRDAWSYHQTTQVMASATLEPTPIPEGSFRPVFVKQGTSVGLFLTIMDPLRNHKILTRLGTTLLSNDFENSHILLKQGAAIQWQPCDNWGVSLTDTSGSPVPHGFLGNLLYKDMSTSDSAPSAIPSVAPSLSLPPSKSAVPSSTPSKSSSPSLAPSLIPSITIMPSSNPTLTPRPTYNTISLRTPNDNDNDGSSGFGLMFDIIAKRPVEIRSFLFSSLQSFPMDIVIYSRKGSHYYAYDDPNEWNTVATFTNWTGGDSTKLPFEEEVSLKVNASVAFYIAIVDTYGQSSPLLGSFLPGSNYRDGIWASDDHIQLMEGVKFYGINRQWPFGMGTTESGVYMLEGPGGTSFNMKDSVIEYRVIDTIMPSTAPSVSQAPTLTAQPSDAPSVSLEPSSSPSVSFAPSDKPSSTPSLSTMPSSMPSSAPSLSPSKSAAPSDSPSVSSMPSSQPSSQPSSMPSETPSLHPSVSSQPSDFPSTLPSASPSISTQPSMSPSVSLMPTMDRQKLVSSSSSASVGAAYGVMFEVKAKRAISVETFAVKHFGNSFSGTATYHIYSKPGKLDSSSWNNVNAWTKMGQVTYVQMGSNPIRLPSNRMQPVEINAQQTRSFYIAFVGNYFRVHEASPGDSSSNADATLYAGLRKYPYDTLFANANQQTYLFQGEMIYTYGVEPPSASPSAFPSLSPSVSAGPSVTSERPSSSPSISSAPTPKPTGKPTTLSPTTDPFKEARIEITIPAKVTLSGFNMPSSTVEMASVVTILAQNIAAAMSKNLNTSQRVKSVKIISVNGVAVSGGFSLRRLESRELSVAAVEYEALLEQICSTSGCTDADTVAATLYDQATDAMKAEIDNGNFASSVQTAATTQSINALLAIAVTTSDFSSVVLTILGLSSIWYPDWVENIGKCLNDGNQPIYMDNSPDLWLSDSRTACCSKYYSYAYNECMGVNAAAIGFYPSWAHGNNDVKCINDAEVPDYMRVDPGSWVYSDAASCCERYFDYDKDACLAASGVTLTGSAYKFYPAWAVKLNDEKCINATDAPAYMKQSPELWLYDDAEECCKRYYDYAGSSCVAASGGASVTGTNKWYVNYVTEKCVKDCDDTSDSDCGGLAKSWDELFSDSDTCCKKKLHWIKRSECTP